MVHMYIHHFSTLDQRDSPVYTSYISLWLGDMISRSPTIKIFMMLRSSVKVFVEDSLHLQSRIKVLIVSFGYDVSVMTSWL